MANVALRIESRPTFRDISGRFAKANDDLLDNARRLLKAEGPVMVDIARKYLRNKTAPYSSDKLGNAIRYNSRITGGTVRLAITAPAHAKPHRIYPRRAGALAFNWPKVGALTIVPKGGGFRTHMSNGVYFVGKGYVDHPGGTLEPLMNPILKQTQNEWNRTGGARILRQISTRWVQQVSK